MKLTEKQLLQQLGTQNLLPGYWLAGDEPLLLQTLIDKLRDKLQQQGFSERHCFEVNHHFDWNQLYSASHNLSLFAEKRLLELRLHQAKLSPAGIKALTHYFSQPPADNVLLIFSPALDNATQKTQWFKQLDKHWGFVPIWPLDSSQLPNWIQQRAQQQGLILDTSAVQLLAEQGEGNLLAIAQNLDKLELSYGKGGINTEQVAADIAQQARFDIFGLMDSLLLKQLERVLKILAALKTEGAEAIIILWAICRELRQLIQLAAAKQRNQFEPTLRALGIWDKRKSLYHTALQQRSISDCYQCLAFAATIDKQLKGVKPGDPWLSLQQLCIALTQASPLQLPYCPSEY